MRSALACLVCAPRLLDVSAKTVEHMRLATRLLSARRCNTDAEMNGGDLGAARATGARSRVRHSDEAFAEADKRNRRAG